MKSVRVLVLLFFPLFLYVVLAIPDGRSSENVLVEARSPAAHDGEAFDKRADMTSTGRRPQRYRPDKYFQEPGDDNTYGHYDIRFFHGLVPYEEHRPVLRHLIRSYLSTFRALGVETWLAHGTLLGWWWNGHIMPWDYDLDVQVSDVTLFYLGKNYNRTTHEYRYRNETTGEEIVKRYLLDINPHHMLPRGDGMNVIDARWIDVSNGMFVDITGLAERDAKRTPGIWSCKNFHRYRTRELYPMRVTEFEGVPATIPYNFDKILIDEYGMKSLVTTKWEDHTWDAEMKEWIKRPVMAIVPPVPQAVPKQTTTDGKDKNKGSKSSGSTGFVQRDLVD